MATLNFLLSGQDRLSHVFDRAGDAATRLHRRISAATTNSSTAINRLQSTAATRLAALDGSAHDSGKAVDALKGALVSLAPAAIPAAAAFAPLAAGVGAAALATAAFGAALGPQISALGEATKAEEKYRDAVEESGATSEDAVKAQAAYAKQMAKLPPATREAAAALSVLKDEYKDWSNGLAKDTMAPVTKGMALLSELLPKLTPMVRGAAQQFDRLVTVAAGGVQTPGFDGLMSRMERFTTGTLRRANDALVHFMRTADTGKAGGGLAEFMDYARAQGPLVADTLRNVGQALTNLLTGASGVGVSMLEVVNTLSQIVAAVPPGAISTLLQLVIALKAVRLAAIGMAAGKAAMAAFGAQIVAMQAAAAGTTGRMAALTASFGALSRGAKLALVGSGIGLLVLALAELSQMGRAAPADVDKMTSSIAQLGKTGKLSGEAARVMGQDFGTLEQSLRTLARPSNLDKTQQWLTQLIGMDSTPVKEAKENVGALDNALAGLVKNGSPELAEAALKRVAAGFKGMTEGELRDKLTGYREALADMAFEAELSAEAMGLFGKQAQQTKAKLDAQKVSADGLRQAIFALNQVNRDGISAQIAFEASLDESTEAARKYRDIWKESGGALDLSTAKGRAAATSLNDLAAKTEEAAAAARQQGQSWQHVNGIMDRGRGRLIAVAMQMGMNRDQAKRLADQILKTPDKTARLKGNLEDLQAKLADAKRRLGSVPDARKAQVRAEIGQLQEKIRQAKGAINSVHGKTVSIMIDYRTRNSGASNFAKSIGGYAGGGTPHAGEWAWVGEAGPELIHFKTGNARVYDHQASMRMGAPTPGRALATAAGPGGGGTTVVNNFTINGALDPVAVGDQIRRVLLTTQRTMGLPPGTVMS
ncbi:hypothetical protein AB0D99_10680 [Streptomyces sp. NPDC047971]|uniref:hypothetical protein n=1 Tax=Streptomyces sp. NPDC047971 TaxID=3154499 RepID=UPI0033D1D7E8